MDVVEHSYFFSIFNSKIAVLVLLRVFERHYAKTNLYLASVLRKMEYFIVRVVLPEAIMIGSSRVNRIVNPGFFGFMDYMFTLLSISYLIWIFGYRIRIFMD